MQDWIGLGFFILLIVGVIVGLKVLSKPQTRTSAEFERRASEGAGGVGAFVNALQDAVDPAAAKSKEVVMQMRDGNYQKKKEDGKGEGKANGETSDK